MISRYQVPRFFFGLWLRKLDVDNFQKLAEQLPWRLPEFDGQPAVAKDVPKNASPEAPRAVFRSGDQRMVLEVAPAKLQFQMLPGEVIETGGPQKGLRPYSIAEAFNAFTPIARKIHSVFGEHYGATANRIGLMAEIFTHIGASANQRMQKALLASEGHFGDRLLELNIQALSRPQLDGNMNVNRWIRVKPLRSNDEKRADLAMAVEVDINTLQEEPYDLSSADVERFLANVQKHIEEQVPLFHEASFFEE